MVRKFQKEIVVSSIFKKTTKKPLISALASKKWSNLKNKATSFYRN